MINHVVVHYADGKIVKGSTGDFFPNKNAFHLQVGETGEMKQISVADLKAVYFVKTLEGNAKYNDRDDQERTGCGRKIKVLFRDGETQIGYTQGYAPHRPGFFVVPNDPASNNERIFVVAAATENVQFV